MKMRLPAGLGVLLLAALSPSAGANCGNAMAGIVHNAYPQAVPARDGYRLAEDLRPHGMTAREIRRDEVACAPWPEHPGWTLVAVRLRHPVKDPDVIEADLDVLVVETRSGKVLYRLFQRNGAESVMDVMNELAIDTTPYRLNSQVTAFGVNLSVVRESVRIPYRLRTLQLYVIEDGKLRRVLTNFHTYMERGESKGGCDGWFETHRVTLSRDHSASKGMWDWLAHTAVTRRTLATVSGECRTSEQVMPVQTSKLSYRGREYHEED